MAPGRFFCPVGAFFIFVFDRQKGGKAMKKMIILGWLALFLPAIIFAEEKVEAPIWNVGDKWVFDREGPMEVTGRDAQCYAVQFAGGIFSKDASGIALFERSTLNVKYVGRRSA